LFASPTRPRFKRQVQWVQPVERDRYQLNATPEQRVKDRVSDLEAANLKLTHEIEQRQLAEAALVQSQKMEAIGECYL